jgi:diaminohydroxyphosphoribosylaminopyrimidine deaminase/5-amino-6-(5-phosphoribosylamino)uracil reductase
VPATLRLFDEHPDRTWVVCGRGAPVRRRRALESRGVRLIESRVRGGHLDLLAVSRRLAKEGLTTLLLEGGGELAAAWLRGRLVDEVHWFLAPRLLGGDGRPSLGALELRKLAASPRLDGEVRRLGGDVYLRSEVRYPARRGDR